MTTTITTTDRPAPPAERIRRKLAAIRQNATHIQHDAPDIETSESAAGIIRRAREIEALLTEIGVTS